MGIKRTQSSGRVDSLGREVKVSGLDPQRPDRRSDSVMGFRDDFAPGSGAEAPTIESMFDYSDFLDQEKAGNVIVRSHPEDEDVIIASYAAHVPYNSEWNDVTMNCRGLIFRRSTGEILARPWAKFFNHNQPEAHHIGDDAAVEVTDKMDGSLIVPYRWGDEHRAATKGSFTSDQAAMAQEMLERYSLDEIDEQWTPMFEVIHPDNRIVLDYGGVKDLYLLGAVNKHTGETIGPNAEELDSWDGPRTQVFSASTPSEALSMPPRRGAEGIIIRDTATGNMVKVKQDDYVRMHKVATGLTTGKIWESLSKGDFETLLGNVPDEMYDSVHGIAGEMISRHAERTAEITSKYQSILSDMGLSQDDLDDSRNKRVFASRVASDSDKGYLFALSSGKTDRLESSLWKEIQPENSRVDFSL